MLKIRIVIPFDEDIVLCVSYFDQVCQFPVTHLRPVIVNTAKDTCFVKMQYGSFDSVLTFLCHTVIFEDVAVFLKKRIHVVEFI